MENKYVKLILDAAIHTLLTVVKLIFLTPLNLWLKTVERLANQKELGLLNLSNISGLWPFFSYIKRILTEFMFDAICFLSYPIGFLLGIIDMFRVDFSIGIGELLFVYFMMPIIMNLLRDGLQLALLPIRKLIDWFRKPAQYLEVNDIKK